MFFQGFETDDDVRVLGLHYPLLRVYDDGSISYTWPRGFERIAENRAEPNFGESFIHFAGQEVLHQCPVSGCYISGKSHVSRREKMKERQESMKFKAGYMCRRFPIVPVRKESYPYGE